MKRYILGLLLLVSVQVQPALNKVSIANPPNRRAHEEVNSGTIDAAFGTSGAYTTSSGQIIRAIKVLRDGHIIAAGGDSSGIRLEKVKKDGSLDTSWATNGVYQVANSMEAYAVEELVNGKLIVASTDGSDSRIEQLTAAGALDTANFGSSGVYSGSGLVIYAIKIKPTGEILIAGDDGSNAMVGQLTAAGALDTDFGTSGTYTNSTSNSIFYTLELLANGKILAAGTDATDAIVEQLTAAGALDTDFGTSGTYTGATATTAVRSIQVRPTGEILIAMTSTAGWKVAQLTSAGALDTANFGTSGVYTSATAIASDDIPYAMALLGDGRVVVAGYDAGWRVECINSGGALDTNFGTSGAYVSAVATATGDELFALAIHPEKAAIIVGGDDGNAWRLEKVINNVHPLRHHIGLAGGLIYYR